MPSTSWRVRVRASRLGLASASQDEDTDRQSWRSVAGVKLQAAYQIRAKRKARTQACRVVTSEVMAAEGS
jgi:hypothetical protein